MSKLFGRKVIVDVGDRKFTSPDLDIEFHTSFDTDSIPDEADCTIYNLSHSSVNYIKKGRPITISAGYGDDIGVVLEGVVSTVRTDREGTDKATIISCINVTSQYLNQHVSKHFKKRISAESVIKSVCSLYGIKLNVLKLGKAKTYKRGIALHGTLNNVLRRLASDTHSKLVVHNSSLEIVPTNTGKTLAYVLKSETGLISVEYLDDDSTPAKYTVSMLFNHAIAPYSILKMESERLKGNVLVIDGNHDGAEFTTTVNVMPL